jgi:predicted acylesterase/phospholipase RssA
MKVSRKDIKYLALEGGGGKGVTYLGAIRALESMGILPINIERPGQNQIAGISGASAGAITALLLGIGLTSRQLEAVLAQSSVFDGFFDGPAPGNYRLVDSQGRSTTGGTPRVDRVSNLVAAAQTGVRITAPGAATVIRVGASAVLGSLLDKLPPAAVNRLRAAPLTYLNNLMSDLGLFPGFAARRFFQTIMARHLSRRILAAAGGNFSKVLAPESIGFLTFFELTGVDLVITGVNVTKHRPAMFSCRLTPDFPVADAVAISMNLPVIFKPVRVDAEVPVTAFNDSATAYQGLWVDGGVLNNLPIHAFDANFTEPARAASGTEPLNSHVVALRLTTGQPGVFPAPLDTDTVGVVAFLDAFADTVLYPSEGGQLRSPDEAEQTIDLYTYNLETVEFAPSPTKSRLPIAEAEVSVLRYFNPGMY